MSRGALTPRASHPAVRFPASNARPSPLPQTATSADDRLKQQKPTSNGTLTAEEW
jgi:hypothetical protein